MQIRLNKYIADSGHCSRRKADELIEVGKVKVNGKVVEEMGTKIDPEKDAVLIIGRGAINRAQTQEKKIYIALNKPPGYTCTARKFKDEKNIFDLIKIKERLFPVGRLDKDSEGLIILTNDGDFANKMMHPRYEHEKEYLVSLDKEIKKSEIERLKKGVKDDGDLLKAKRIKQIGKKELNIVLTEGKKRHIRRMLKAVGLQTKKLKRVRVGDTKLGDLKTGEYKKIKPN